ncbi:MAG: glycoside hydrolase family 13 protein [Synergistaceae bacterium]|nr:glycoside hydrolase family 13 protein [Synergistaceae bacterium]
MVVLHETTREYIFAIKRNRLHIRLQIIDNEPVKCKIFYWNRFHSDLIFEKSVPCVGADASRKFHECDLDLHDTAQYIQYYFELETQGETAFWGRIGYEANKPHYYFEYLSTAELDIIDVPRWAKGAVWYQIFPERFYNGNVSNDPADAQPWGTPPTRENHFGGDLAGIIEKLPYLQELGTDVLYLTPVFFAPSNHKYDTIDYFSIDPAFGTTQDLIELVRQCHSHGMKVVLDGVFNHIGYYSPQFQDVVEKGADSKYIDWFYIKNFPIELEPPNYECVGYHKWMPKLRYKTKAVRDFILSVGRYWIETADIDGWRLDVADEVDFTFWQEFRREIKSIKPEAFLLAETWKSGLDMLRGDQMDSVMNYLFRDAVADFFATRGIDAVTFEHRIAQMLFGYSHIMRLSLYNALGSHDTARFLTMCNNDIRKFKLAIVFQMTFSGMPAIYYGDEIGIDGENDPDCRKTMDWDNVDNALRSFYIRLTSLRRKLPSLKYGDYKSVYSQKNMLAFARQYGSETTYIIINNGEEAGVARVPMLEDAFGIAWRQSVFSGGLIVPEPIAASMRLHNQDIFDYKSLFKIELEAYHFEIVTIKKLCNNQEAL